jgi:hypothetical protein
MSEAQRIMIAKEYVDQQIATMREGGMLSDNVSEEEYRGLVEEITEAIDLK